MNLVDGNGNLFGNPLIEITGPDGKPKTISGGGSPSGPAGGDLLGTYPNPTVDWSNGTSTYNSLYYPLVANPSGYLTAITSLDVTTALGYTPVNQSGDSMLGYLTLFSDPTAALHAATKQYVDNISAGINFHTPCHVATTGNLSATYLNGAAGVGATLTSIVNGALVIDSHTPVLGDRVLVWQQSSGLQNGIYDVTNAGSASTPWVLTRSSDADNSPSGELQNGDFAFVQQGTLYGGFGFILNTTGTIIVGTTAINYVQFNAAQAVAAGYGLQELSPNVLSVDTSLIATVSSLGAYLTSATAASTYVPLTRTLTINGTTQDLSADRTFTVTSPDPAGWTTIVKSASQDVTGSTLVDDSEFQFSVVAGGNYLIELIIATSGNGSTNDYQFRFALSSGLMIGAGSAIHRNASSTQTNSAITALNVINTNSVVIGQNGGTIPSTSGVISASGNYAFYVNSNATLKFQFACASGTASVARTWKGSILKYKRID